MLNRRLKIFLAGTLLLPLAQAAELQTDWITPVEGSQEATMGASVKTVETDAQGDKITIAIPKESMASSDDIDEVIVVGKSPDKSEQQLDVRHEWVKDYDKDFYGLVLYLGKNGDIPLRLYLKSDEE